MDFELIAQFFGSGQNATALLKCKGFTLTKDIAETSYTDK